MVATVENKQKKIRHKIIIRALLLYRQLAFLSEVGPSLVGPCSVGQPVRFRWLRRWRDASFVGKARGGSGRGMLTPWISEAPPDSIENILKNI